LHFQLNNGYVCFLQKNLRKEACWLLSNIAAGTKEQLDSVFQYPDLLERVIEVARTDKWEVRKEALWVVANMFTTGQDNHVRALVQGEGFAALAEALHNINETKILAVVLEAIEAVLQLGNTLNLNYSQMFDELGGLDKLEELQEHPSEEIYEQSVKILEQYFGVEDEEDENIVPAHVNGTFHFGMNAPAKQLFPEASEPERHAPVLGQANYDFSMQH
jgi:importin subunit alpha-6/7